MSKSHLLSGLCLFGYKHGNSHNKTCARAALCWDSSGEGLRTLVMTTSHCHFWDEHLPVVLQGILSRRNLRSALQRNPITLGALEVEQSRKAGLGREAGEA